MSRTTHTTLVSPSGWAAAAVLLALLAAGCGRNRDIQVYRLAKDTPEPSPAAAPAPTDMPAPGPANNPQGLTWTLPAGWEQKPASEMRVASFAVTGPGGAVADVSVIPLPSGGPELDLVNMWREQMRLPALASGEAAPQADTVSIGSDSGKLFDIASQDPIIDGKARARILVAMATRGTTSWFFKMSGDAAFVQRQRPGFEQFLKSVTLPTGPVAGTDVEPGQFSNPHNFLSTNAKDAPGQASDKPVWIVPPGWRELPASQFLLAKFEVGSGDSKADVNVSMLAGSGGGMLANINRWRRQLGLEPVDDAGLDKLLTSVDTDGGKAAFVDLRGSDAKTGQPARMIGAVVPQNGQTWFYKLMGNDATVEQARDTFTKFVQHVKYPNAL